MTISPQSASAHRKRDDQAMERILMFILELGKKGRNEEEIEGLYALHDAVTKR